MSDFPASKLFELPWDTSNVSWLDKDQCAVILKGSSAIPLCVESHQDLSASPFAIEKTELTMDWYVEPKDLFMLMSTTIYFKVGFGNSLNGQPVKAVLQDKRAIIVKLRKPDVRKLQGRTIFGFICYVSDLSRYNRS